MALASVRSLLDFLRQERLLPAASLAEAERLAGEVSDARALAVRLVQAGLLTPFQADHLVQGRAAKLTLKDYVLLEPLGEGGMGKVFKARHRLMNRHVALKVVHPEALHSPQAIQRFEREMQLAAQVDHPNIIRAHDAGVVEDNYFYVMELVHGIDLAKLVEEEGPLPIPLACDFTRQVALGLEHIHEKGLVHRDIKPQNLIAVLKKDAAGRKTFDAIEGIKILDLGLAILRPPEGNGKTAMGLTRAGAVMGTPDFMAPEQTTDAHKVDIRADLYSLGCTLYFLMTGHLVYYAGTVGQKLLQHREGPIPDPRQYRPEVPEALVQTLRVLIAKRKEDRFATPGEAAEALQPFANTPGSWPGAIERETPAEKDLSFWPFAPSGEIRATSTGVNEREAPAEKDLSFWPFAPSGEIRATSTDVNEQKGQARLANSPAASQTGPRPSSPRSRRHWFVLGGVLIGLFLLALVAFMTKGISGLEERNSGKGLTLDWAKGEKDSGGLDVFPHKREVPKKMEAPPKKPEAFPKKLVGGPKKVEEELKKGHPKKEPPRPKVGPPPKTLTNSINMKLAWIEPGRFRMGSPAGEKDRQPGEFQHEVEITQGFYMGVYVVTQEEYRQVMGSNPSRFAGVVVDKDTNPFPVENVSWNEAMEFCRKLTEREKGSGRVYDLPTEAEWEYACRAGSRTVFAFGDALGSDQANFDGSLPYGGAAKGPYLGRTTEVGSYMANAWGLHDMHGNVWEWCKDWWEEDYYRESPVKDPAGPATGSRRVLRGGSWYYGARYCRSAQRNNNPPDYSGNYIGFRVVVLLSPRIP